MKKILIITFVIILSLSTCKKIDYTYEGEILGKDYTECACCGGTLIKIENKTYRFWEDPMDWKIDLTEEELPVKVKLNYRLVKEQCMGNEIVVEDLKIK